MFEGDKNVQKIVIARHKSDEAEKENAKQRISCCRGKRPGCAQLHFICAEWGIYSIIIESHLQWQYS